MKRRALSLVLALVFVVCLLPVSVFAAQDLTTSSAAVSLIKHFEGFHKFPYWDYGQYTVGYGTRCPSDKLAYYMRYGITEAEATALLKKQLRSFEGDVNHLNEEYGLELEQHEFDGLVLFTYNVGQGWIYNESNGITQAVINDAGGDDFIFALTRWCKAGGELSMGLVKRRLIEANVYLNGDYSEEVPDYHGYVLFAHTDSVCNGERTAVPVQGYDAAGTAEVRPMAVRSGYRFLGWYTASTGGKWISHLDASTNGITLYPHWQYGNGNVSGGVLQGTAASYERIAAEILNVYTEPSASAAVRYTLSAGTRISVVADYVNADGMKWGKLTDGGWVKLGETDPILDPAEGPEKDGILVTVTASRMNVRSGPGANYKRVRYAYEGEKMRITEVRDVNGIPWGQFDEGWICLDYTDYGTEKETVIATGHVTTSTDYLNIRAGAGTGYDIVGRLNGGDRVEIYEIVTVGGSKWGRISEGWISMAYVILDAAEEPPVEEPTEEPTEAPTEAPTEEPTEAPTEAPTEPPVEGDKGDQVIATGTINITSGSLNVRAGAGSDYAVVGSLKKGAKVEIYEYATVSGTQWGRISGGWISMNYVKLDPTASEEQGQAGTVSVGSSGLNVRSGPGFTYAVVAKLTNGTKVTVYETKTVGSVTWGHVAQGWVSMEYIKLDAAAEPPKDNGGKDEEAPAVTDGTRTGTVTDCDALNVRSGAGTGYTKVGSVKSGTKVTIAELKVVGSTVWGKISSGWISLDYVKLDPISAGSLTMVNNSYVNIRSGAGTSYAKVGTYSMGDVLIILETKKVGGTTWGKTAKGWISLDYAL